MKSTCIKVLKVRVKDRHAPLLRSMATEVNQVWNYCNDLSDRMIRERGRWMSGFDFSAYTVGASKQFEHIGSSTIQETAEHYASKRYLAKRRKLRWRKSFGDERSLGWVPFKARAAHWKHGQVFFAGSHVKVWASFKTMLDYKSRQAGIVYREINEAYTTRACSECGSGCGPQGTRALSVRDWQCVECGVQHDRDVNAARNILRLGAGHCAP